MSDVAWMVLIVGVGSTWFITKELRAIRAALGPPKSKPDERSAARAKGNIHPADILEACGEHITGDWVTDAAAALKCLDANKG